MQPITRATAHSFCRTCLQELTSKTGVYDIYKEKNLDKWLHTTTGIALLPNQIAIFPSSLCAACYIKARVFDEYRMKTYCAAEALKLLIEEQKSNPQILNKLSTICRICLHNLRGRQGAQAQTVNAYETLDVRNWLSECAQLVLDASAAIEEVMPQFVCPKCIKKLSIHLEFRRVTKQSLEYLSSILEITNDEVELPIMHCKTELHEENMAPTYGENVADQARLSPLMQIKVEEPDFDESLPSAIFAEQLPLLKCNSEQILENNFVCKQELEEENIEVAASEEVNFVVGDGWDLQQSPPTDKKKKPGRKKKSIQTLKDNLEQNRRSLRVSASRKPKNSKSSDEEDDKTPMLIAEEKCAASKQKFTFTCEQCAKCFNKQWLYEGHMRIHQGDAKPYHCEHCAQKFRHHSMLYRHLHDIHQMPQKPNSATLTAAPSELDCGFCCKTFKRHDHLRDHVNSVHKLIKPFKCSYCSRTFSLARTLRIHEMRHTGECPYVCETCGRRYRKTTDLKIHMEKHTTPPELLCPVCKRAKKTVEELQAHVASHEASMRHQCTKCGMLFKRAAHLTQHDKAVHMKLRPFKCHYCDKSFALLGTATAHERIHTGERPELCQICSATFKTRRGLRAHMKRHAAETVHSALDTQVDNSLEPLDATLTKINQLFNCQEE